MSAYDSDQEYSSNDQYIEPSQYPDYITVLKVHPDQHLTDEDYASGVSQIP